MTLAFLGAVSACVNDDFEDKVINKTSVDGLALSPTIADGKVVTRADSDTNLKEDELVTLDVFVEEVGNTDSFFKKYHLTIAGATKETINNKVAYLLENKWFEQGYRAEKKYNVYVAVNNPMTLEATDETEITNSAALKALTYDEVKAGVAEVNEEGNIISKYLRTETIEGKERDVYAYTGNIYKLYNESASTEETSRDQTPNKKFMMDGWVENWSPTEGKPIQTIPVNLSRAAAKIVLNVNFDATFLSNLQKEGVTITGSPAWQFQNFAFNAPVFDPKILGTTTEEDEEPVITPRSADFMIFGGTEFATDKSFSIITYSYPISWDDYNTGAPSLIISIPYTSADGSTSYNYYRVPIVTNSAETEKTSIDRNTIYEINATIATRGSDTHEDITVIGDLNYNVLPWNDKNNSDVMENAVTSIQHYYLNVSPKVYTLRGDGDQSIKINYSKAAGTSVNWKVFTYDEDGNQLAVVSDNEDGATRGWFYNSTGDFTDTYDDSTNYDWSKMGVVITPDDHMGVDYSSGTIEVSSRALTNKAIKYIRLRVYLVEKETTLYEDVIIRHFPTDNIQNIEGLWSSYTGATSTHTLTTRNEAEALEWVEEYNGTLKQETISGGVNYIDYSTYLANASDTEHYHMEGPTATDYETFHQMVQDATSRQNANSQANAVADDGEGHSYYWGTAPATRVAQNVRNYTGQWDYRIYNSGIINARYDYYKYPSYQTATYTYTFESYTLYTVTYTTEEPSTWVDWTDQTAHTPQRTYEINYAGGGQFLAKVFLNNRMYRITEQRQGTYGNYSWTTVRGSQDNVGHLNNPHMYVIQISSTSDDYVLGRPVLGNPSAYQSRDDVASPAFMIASQLGAVLPFEGNNAATYAAQHCSLYKEVTEDGTVYDGWRLPTQSEIRVISRYQNGTINNVTIPANYRTMTAVLTGERYWCLSGNRINTNTNQIETTGTAYLRCVRDLSAEEVEKLNGFDKIIEKYARHQ